MNPKQFLVLGGIILVVVGVLGMLGPLGPTAADSLFGEAWWFDTAENWAHVVLGIVALAAVFLFPAGIQKPLVMLVGIVAILVGLYSLLVDTMLLGANLENPADTVLHVVIGIWALWASMMKKEQSIMSSPSGM